MWSEPGLPAPNYEVSTLFFHTTGKEQHTREKVGSTTCMTNWLAVQINEFILQRQPDARAVILCYYNPSQRYIKQRQPGVKIYSIYRYDGRECDFAIIVTTRVQSKEMFWNVVFVLDSQRTTVPITRASEGIFLIIDQDILGQSPVWKTFIERFPCARGFLIEFYDSLSEYKHQVTANLYFARSLR